MNPLHLVGQAMYLIMPQLCERAIEISCLDNQIQRSAVRYRYLAGTTHRSLKAHEHNALVNQYNELRFAGMKPHKLIGEV